MNQFSYKGQQATAVNNGLREIIPVVDMAGRKIDLAISGDRIEIVEGGGTHIYQVSLVSVDSVSEQIFIDTNHLFLNKLADGTQQVVLNRKDRIYVPQAHFRAYASLPGVANVSLIKQMFLHGLNALAARVPQLGGDVNGWGVEIFALDGTFKQPIFIYKKMDAALALEPIHGTAPFTYSVDGVAIEKQAIDEATGEPKVDASGNPVMEPHNVAEGLAPGFHSFQVTDAAGLTETRNILV